MSHRGNSCRGRFPRGRRGYKSVGSRFGKRFHQQQKPNIRKETPGKRLCEEDIGITQYISEHKGFAGIIKLRYSDFQVSEINKNGEIAKLTDLNPPPLPDYEPVVVNDEDLVLSKYNLEILPMDIWDKLHTLMISMATMDRIEFDVTGMSKEHRTKIHEAVRKAFCETIIGSTVTVDDKKFVRFEKYRKGMKYDSRVKWTWPHDYVHFIVYKENCDTMDAALRIAERLKLIIKPAMLGYAGTKDRRAKTAQWFSLRRIDPQKIASSCKGIKDVYIGDYRFSDTHIKLGLLKGNLFRIALRNVTDSEEVMNSACEALKSHGFLNYYGLQRFGTRFETPTYVIGRKILQNDFKGAIDVILQERADGPLRSALRKYKQNGIKAAVEILPKYVPHYAIEIKLMKALARNPRDIVGAFNMLARNTRLLYTHSYQSLIWNKCVSERVRRYGLVPAVGDLVLLTNITDEVLLEDDTLSDTVEHTVNTDQDNEKICGEQDDEDEQDNNGEQEDGAEQDSDVVNTSSETATGAKENKQNEKGKKKTPVKVLTEEDIASNKYTIYNVVLPLPGYFIEYPPNMKDYYEELLNTDGLSMTLKHKIKCYSMSGTYRYIVVRPIDMSWSHVTHNDPYADLILSDLDLINKKKLATVQDGKFRALLLTMSLPSSCYATMALRELLKADTSGDSQAQQNLYYKEQALYPNDEIDNEREDTGVNKQLADTEISEANISKISNKNEELNVTETNYQTINKSKESEIKEPGNKIYDAEKSKCGLKSEESSVIETKIQSGNESKESTVADTENNAEKTKFKVSESEESGMKRHINETIIDEAKRSKFTGVTEECEVNKINEDSK